MDDALSPELAKLRDKCARFAVGDQKAKFAALLAKKESMLTNVYISDLHEVTVEQAAKDAVREELVVNNKTYCGGPDELLRLRADFLEIATEIVAR